MLHAMSTPFDRAAYISVRSYKMNGDPVDTPVWVAPLDGKLVVFTLRDSYKVKRVRRNPKVQLAECDVRGKLRGPWHDATCRIVEGEPEFEKRGYAALLQKYGWQMAVGNFFSALTGRMKNRLLLEISLPA
jgi:PPOX class probable F420-dependent enzyme